MYSWFDSHSHPQDAAYAASADQIAHEADERGIAVLAVGTDFAMSRAAVELAESHANVYAAVGIHPADNPDEEFDGGELYKELLESDKVVAIGECGLDFYRLPEDPAEAARMKERQVRLFAEQVAFANAFEKPVVIHCRDAYDELAALLSEKKVELENGGVVHCFTGTPEQAEALVALGLHIGITGIVTFPKADNVRAVAAMLPADRLLIETDAPYLAPAPHRGETNYPHHVPLVGAEVAKLRNVSSEEIARVTTDNAMRLFRIPSEPLN